MTPYGILIFLNVNLTAHMASGGFFTGIKTGIHVPPKYQEMGNYMV